MPTVMNENQKIGSNSERSRTVSHENTDRNLFYLYSTKVKKVDEIIIKIFYCQ